MTHNSDTPHVPFGYRFMKDSEVQELKKREYYFPKENKYQAGDEAAMRTKDIPRTPLTVMPADFQTWKNQKKNSKEICGTWLSVLEKQRPL